MENEQISVSEALADLGPEKLFDRAVKFKQKSNILSSTTPILSGRLAEISSLVEGGNIPPSLNDLPLPDEDKQAIVTHALKQVSAESMSNAQAVLAAAFNGHTKLEAAYYQDAINQSKRSFTVALVAAVIAVPAFLGAIAAGLLSAPSNTATIATIGGTIAALVSGVNFYLYGMASTQLAAFHARLDRLQRFSLAEYMCELLETETARDNALATVIANLASSTLADSPTYITPLAPPSPPNTPTGQQPASDTPTGQQPASDTPTGQQPASDTQM